MTFTEANTRCHQHGGYLAEINDKEEYNFVINGVMSGLGDDDDDDPATRIGAKWSGTRDADKWVYMTSGGDVTYTYTVPGYTLSQLEDLCLVLARPYNGVSGRSNGQWGMWSDDCSWRWNRHTLCEIPAA